MKQLRVLAYAMCLLALCSCSTHKNTGLTRSVQAFKARYNTYFNGHQAYLEGYGQQRDGNKDNYTETLPYLMIGNKATQTLGSGQFDRAIEKSQKTIKLHSITAKPEVSAAKRRTAKGKAWLAQKEYNPFLPKAWMLMGQAQMQKGEFFEAASTFAYTQRLFSNKPNVVAAARVMEATCYAEMDWYFEAEDLITRARRDTFPTKLNTAAEAVLANCQLRRGNYNEAATHLAKAIKGQRGSIEKARLYFLLGQLYHLTGQNQQAFKAFKKVYAKNPPYELEFNARIQQTEVLSAGQSKKMISKLRRMARSEKNKTYLDQVYYAIGNIYLAEGDTLGALYAYKDGVEKSTRNGIEKGVVWLHLGALYWDRGEFVKAQPCYAGALGLMDKDRPDYDMVDERSKILDELMPYASAVELQDSLQALARMDSVERMQVIERLIEEVKKKEKEEARQANQQANAERSAQTAAANRPAGQQTTAARNTQNQANAIWYFYNPTSVSAGKTEFKRKWGDRPLADNWRRNNKTVLADLNEEQNEASEPEETEAPTNSEPADTLQLTDEQREALEKQQEYEADPHRPEYYLKDIPFTDEQMEASNLQLMDGLYNSAIIYKDRMENFTMAEQTFQRLLIDFPDFEHTDEVYYNMFQLYSRIHNSDEAEAYRQKLIDEFPDNEHAKLVADPQFEFKARYGKHIEDSLYQDAYDAYLADNYPTVIANADYTAKEYPEGENRPRFMFLKAMSQLSQGETAGFMAAMREIVSTYPQSTVSELAGLYVKGMQEGRLLASGKGLGGSIWERRMSYAEADSLMADTTFSDEKNNSWLFVVAYEHDSINENQLLFEMARYNFSNFSVRNFDITIERQIGIDMLQVRSFVNYDEAYIYLHRLMNNAEMAEKLEGLKLFIISDDNLAKIMRGLSFADYFEFYDEVFDRVGKLNIDEGIIDEPNVDIMDPDDLYELQKDAEEEELYYEEEENYIF